MSHATVATVLFILTPWSFVCLALIRLVGLLRQPGPHTWGELTALRRRRERDWTLPRKPA